MQKTNRHRSQETAKLWKAVAIDDHPQPHTVIEVFVFHRRLINVNYYFPPREF